MWGMYGFIFQHMEMVKCDIIITVLQYNHLRWVLIPRKNKINFTKIMAYKNIQKPNRAFWQIAGYLPHVLKRPSFTDEWFYGQLAPNVFKWSHVQFEIKLLTHKWDIQVEKCCVTKVSNTLTGSLQLPKCLVALPNIHMSNTFFRINLMFS